MDTISQALAFDCLKSRIYPTGPNYYPYGSDNLLTMSMQQRYRIQIVATLNGRQLRSDTFQEFPVTIGRDPNSSVPLTEDLKTSGHHATIVESEGKLTYIDLNSSNGSYLNGTRIERHTLEDSQTFQLGDCHLEVNVFGYKDDSKTQETTLTNIAPASQQDTDDVAADWGMRMMQFIPTTHKRALQARLTWKGETIENHVFYPGESVYINKSQNDGIYLPQANGVLPLAKFDGHKTQILIPPACRAELLDEKENQVKKRLDPNIAGKFRKTSFKNDELRLYFANDLSLEFRHIESPPPYSHIKFFLPEKLFKKSLTFSAVVHLLILIVGLIAIPQEPAPKIKNVPDRIARLLVKKPKPKPKVEKPKPKPEKKVVKKPEPKPKPKVKPKAKPKKVARKKKILKPKKVVVRKDPKLKKINKYPFTVKTKNVAKKPVKGPPSKKKDVKQLGALAALGALGKSTPNPSNKPVAININKNAGGAPGKMQANSVIGALKTKGGKLAAGGSGSLKTKGKGYGTGTGYGVQGIKGSAGARGVGATVVGAPELMKINKQEGLSQQQVMAVVRKHSGKISSCYERALLSSPGLAGRVEYQWRILPKGRVTWAKVKASNISGADELNACVIGVFKKMKFPVAKNGQETIPSIGFPFGRL